MAAPTPNRGLARPDDGTNSWGDDYRAAMDTLDATGVFVQPDQPVGNGPYLWVQTGLGDDGSGFTLWVEDGS